MKNLEENKKGGSSPYSNELTNQFWENNENNFTDAQSKPQITITILEPKVIMWRCHKIRVVKI